MLYKDNIGEISHIYLPKESILWSVPNFLCTTDNIRPCVTSPWFTYFGVKWRLGLVPCCNDPCIGLFLWSNQPPNHQYQVRLRLHNHKLSDDSIICGRLDPYGHFGHWEFLHCPTHESWEINVSPNGLLMFSCEMWKPENITKRSIALSSVRSEAVINEDNDKKNIPEAKGVDRLVQNLKTLFQNEQSYDVVLKADGREFRVHKAILVSRSPVFTSMFQHDMAEKNSGVVDIPDCTAEAFEIFLLYLYTGSVDTISCLTMFNLYYAADKYQVNDLKEDCVEFMKANLTVDTFCDIITLAVQHSESGLQETATRFFCDNVKIIVKTVEWQQYLQKDPIHANELFIKVINA